MGGDAHSGELWVSWWGPRRQDRSTGRLAGCPGQGGVVGGVEGLGEEDRELGHETWAGAVVFLGRVDGEGVEEVGVAGEAGGVGQGYRACPSVLRCREADVFRGVLFWWDAGKLMALSAVAGLFVARSVRRREGRGRSAR
jgi:hypothetical protein